MRLRICRQLPASIDGISLDRYQVGLIYDVDGRLGHLFAAEGWAVPAIGASRFTTLRCHRRLSLILVVDDDVDMRKLTTGRW